ncbi:acyl-CoA dehydrogenase [Salmonella enterica subsp. enterica]|nr:acyl-CoA dehydrogenase [Salmonella enterica subsp. enterica]EGV2902163.1 acyl-CoA dehydrogenase [Salmonella enterica]EHC0798151.1 acyl-CoA dehydrogenase [Salmonella enterica]EIE7938872.1 acyl-CoA dehydrogenase family protein [Salmonella enterica]
MNQCISHDLTLLSLPFFTPGHQQYVHELDRWCQQQRETLLSLRDRPVAEQSRQMLHLLGKGGWLEHLNTPDLPVPNDARRMCLSRQTLAYFDDLLDFSWSIQSLSASVIQRYGNEAQRSDYLPALARGERIAAFALSELQAGTDIAALTLEAQRCEDGWLLNGEKAWIALGDIASDIIVIARTGEGPGPLGLSAFIVDAAGGGVSARPLDAVAPRSWSHLRFDNVRVSPENLLGQPGQGFIIALDILDRFRMTVASAAVGFARRAADIALRHAAQRKIYRGRLLDLQLTQATLAKMEVSLSAASLLTARAAWQHDDVRPFARESAAAKYFACEQACKIVDDALQLLGAAGIVAGSQLERLYRQIRPLRIYEGASEALLMNIASALDTQRVINREDLS